MDERITRPQSCSVFTEKSELRIVNTLGLDVSMRENALGAYVHTIRLQYVEFFGKFYEGGGKAFAPFSTKTKYVRFKED